MDRLSEILKLAFLTLWANRMRSALTVLGVMIGVACVVAIGSIMSGLDSVIVEEMRGFGGETMFIYKFAPGVKKGRRTKEERTRKPMAYKDYEAVKQACVDCERVGVVLFGAPPTNVRYKSQEFQSAEFSGGKPEYPESMNMPIARGRRFTTSDDLYREEVTIIGADVAKTLFVNEDPLGKTVIAGGRNLTVIGIFDRRRAAGSFAESSADKQIVVPYGTFKKFHPAAEEHFLTAQARPGRMNAAISQVRSALRVSRHDKPGDKDSFGVTTATSIIEQFHDIIGTIAIVIVVLSSLGLLVGGVGVMNIMLVSVSERTREIGIRKAIGAKRRDILLQFLLEACTLTGTGGFAGILAGCAISALINRYMPSLPSSVPLWSVVLGFTFSVGVGVVFGMWPAWRASRLNPVDALRFE
jgi:putative ABC transport system permease protein